MFIAKDEINMHYYWYDSQLTGLFNSDSHAFIATRLNESSHTKRVRRHNADYTAAYPMNISQCSPANMIQAFIMQLNRSRRLFLFALFRLIEWYLYNEMKRSNEKKLHTPHLMHFCHVNISIYIANIDNVLETVARPCEYSAFHSIIFTCKWTFMNVHKHLYDAISLHLSENYCRKIATLINSIQFHPGKNSSAHNKIKFKCDKIHFEYFLNSVQC